MCGGFHAKFQDSRTNNKKPTQHSYAKSRLAVYATVCLPYFGKEKNIFYYGETDPR